MAGRTALLVPVPEAEAIVGDLRARHDPSATVGVPAHVTALFPFLPGDEIDETVERSLRDLFGAQPPFAYRFASVGRFAHNVHLMPESGAQFSRLTAALAARWPDHLPYEGVFDVVIPHLTAADQVDPDTADAISDELERRLAESGPVIGRAHELWLVREGTQGHWSTVAHFALGAAS